MPSIIEFLDFLLPYGTHSYVVMFLVLLACGFGFPMPEDVVLISGGVLAARGICDIWIVFAVCMAGVMIGDSTVFMIGRHLGVRAKQIWPFRRIFTPKMDDKIHKVFTKYGDKIIFCARFMPGLRMPIFMSAGIYKVSFKKFFAIDFFAAIISVPVWIWLGNFFGQNLEVLEKKAKQFQYGTIAALIVGIILLVIVYRLKERFFRVED
jgi:membrane protein DedA with SNARE-associated domain